MGDSGRFDSMSSICSLYYENRHNLVQNCELFIHALYVQKHNLCICSVIVIYISSTASKPVHKLVKNITQGTTCSICVNSGLQPPDCQNQSPAQYETLTSTTVDSRQ